MSLSDLAAIGSFISGAAVAVSLVFLTIQLRQANLNQRSLMQQARAARNREATGRLADPEIAKVVARAESVDVELEAWEVGVVWSALGIWFMGFEDSFLQYRAGTLDTASWEADVTLIRGLADVPIYRTVWKLARGFYAAAFVEYVDGLMNEASVRRDILANVSWRNLLTIERKVAPA